MTRQRLALYVLLSAVGAAAAVLSFSALRDLALLCGFSDRLAWLLPVTIDAGAAASSLVWLGPWAAAGARAYGRTLAVGLLVGSVGGNALGHGLEAYGARPHWLVVVGVSAIAPAVLGALVHLVVLVGRPESVVERMTDVELEAASDAAGVEVVQETPAGAPTVVYHLWSEDETLLYVGITGRLKRRLAEHAQSKPWWGDVANVTVKVYPQREQALAVEKYVIETYDPPYNFTTGALADAVTVNAARREADRTGRVADLPPVVPPMTDDQIIRDLREVAAGLRRRPSRDEMLERYKIGAPRARRIRNLLGWLEPVGEPTAPDRTDEESAEVAS